jgi:MFS family permease
LKLLTEPFGISTGEIGLLVTAVTAPAIMLIPVSGLLADRVGWKPVLTVGLLCFGLGGIGIAFTNDFEIAPKLRVLQGPGFAGITPVIITSLSDFYSGDTEATAQGIRFSVTGLSQAVFPAIAGATSCSGGSTPSLFIDSQFRLRSWSPSFPMNRPLLETQGLHTRS